METPAEVLYNVGKETRAYFENHVTPLTGLAFRSWPLSSVLSCALFKQQSLYVNNMLFFPENILVEKITQKALWLFMGSNSQGLKNGLVHARSPM